MSDNSTEASIVSGIQRVICSTLMTAILCMGIAGCSSIIYGILKTRQFSTFNIICMTRTVANLVVLVAIIILYAPMAMTGSSYLPFLFNSWISYFAIFIYSFNQMVCLLLAVNRFIALWLPLQYKVLCNNKISGVFLVLLAFLAVARSGNPLQSPNCLMNFNAYSMSLTISPDHCTSLDPEGTVVEIIFAATIAINILTFSKCSWLFTGGCRGTRAARYLTSSGENRTKKNIILFFQTVLQDFLFVIDMLFTTKLDPFLRATGIIPKTWTKFICHTFAWLLVYAADSVIMLILQPDLVIKRIERISSNQVSTTLYQDSQGKNENIFIIYLPLNL